MKRMMLAGSALVALGGCATGQPYTGVEAGPTAVSESSVPVAIAPAVIPVPDNILLAEWTGPYGGVPPWDQVKIAQFSEALQFSIAEQRRECLRCGERADDVYLEMTTNLVERLVKQWAANSDAGVVHQSE